MNTKLETNRNGPGRYVIVFNPLPELGPIRLGSWLVIKCLLGVNTYLGFCP